MKGCFGSSHRQCHSKSFGEEVVALCRNFLELDVDSHIRFHRSKLESEIGRAWMKQSFDAVGWTFEMAKCKWNYKVIT